MNTLKTLRAVLIIGLVSSVAYAGAQKNTFQCTEYDLQTDKWGNTELVVELGGGPRGVDQTTIAIGGNEFVFRNGYEQTKSPHYRWGYADLYQADLAFLSRENLFGNLVIKVENQGPTYEPDGSHGYYVRGIDANLQLFAGAGTVKKKIYLLCESK